MIHVRKILKNSKVNIIKDTACVAGDQHGKVFQRALLSTSWILEKLEFTPEALGTQELAFHADDSF